MRTRPKRPPDRPLAMGYGEDLPAMLAAFCRECDSDLMVRVSGDVLEVRIGHDRDCPRWVAAQRETA